MNPRSGGGPTYYGPSAQSGGGPTYYGPSAQSGGGPTYFGPSAQSGGGPKYFRPSAQSGGGPYLPPPWSNPLGPPIHAPQFRNSGPGGPTFIRPQERSAGGLYEPQFGQFPYTPQFWNGDQMGNVVTENANDDVDLEEDTNDSVLVVSIRKLLSESKTSFSSTCCIYRSPEGVRRFNEAAYAPKLIIIGPHHLHVSKFGLGQETPWEKELKRVYCRKLINRSKKSLNSIMKHLEEYKDGVYRSYDENNWEYLNVTLFHACFVVEHLIRSHYPEHRDQSDNMPLMERRRNQIKRDLLLMDNQIPYFFLESLYDLVVPSSLAQMKFSDLVMSFFKEYERDDMVPDFTSVKHFTDLIRTLHKPTIRQSEEQSYPHIEYTLSATQLYSAGVEFKMVPGNCLLDINFKSGCLELPCFELNNDQESLFRNLMAFELCHYPDNTFIIDYFVFMDALINTSEDVSLLIKAGVLVNRIGDHSDAANTFNKFCAGVTPYRAANSYLVPVLWELNEYYKKPKHTHMTTFKRDYCGTPLRIASTITAVLLVLLTFISTVCSIMSII